MTNKNNRYGNFVTSKQKEEKIDKEMIPKCLCIIRCVYFLFLCLFSSLCFVCLCDENKEFERDFFPSAYLIKSVHQKVVKSNHLWTSKPLAFGSKVIIWDCYEWKQFPMSIAWIVFRWGSIYFSNPNKNKFFGKSLLLLAAAAAKEAK